MVVLFFPNSLFIFNFQTPRPCTFSATSKIPSVTASLSSTLSCVVIAAHYEPNCYHQQKIFWQVFKQSTCQILLTSEVWPSPVNLIVHQGPLSLFTCCNLHWCGYLPPLYWFGLVQWFSSLMTSYHPITAPIQWVS